MSDRKLLSVVEWDSGEYAIGHSESEPLLYFGEECLPLAGELVALYNAQEHVCTVVQLDTASDTWVCVQCGKHHDRL